MRNLIGLAAIVLAGCGSSSSASSDVSGDLQPDVSQSCGGVLLSTVCCCDLDVVKAPTCVSDEWNCGGGPYQLWSGDYCEPRCGNPCYLPCVDVPLDVENVDNGTKCTPGDHRVGEAACFAPNCAEGWGCPQGVPTGCISSGCSCTSDGIWVCLPDCNHMIGCVQLTDLPVDAFQDVPD